MKLNRKYLDLNANDVKMVNYIFSNFAYHNYFYSGLTPRTFLGDFVQSDQGRTLGGHGGTCLPKVKLGAQNRSCPPFSGLNPKIVRFY